LDLNQTRASSGFGISAINYTEIMNYCLLMQIQLLPVEVEAIKIMDNIVRELVSNNQEQEKASK
jgi:hypothetical protein